MANSIKPNDILWTRTGDPVLVSNKNEQNGDVYLENKFSKVQEVAKDGLKNGLTIPEREAYKSTLSGVKNMDKKQEIQDLYQKIKSLKEGNTNPRLLKYLESELQYRMIRENYIPPDYGIKPVTLDI
jgi:hypothetical protein